MIELPIEVGILGWVSTAIFVTIIATIVVEVIKFIKRMY